MNKRIGKLNYKKNIEDQDIVCKMEKIKKGNMKEIGKERLMIKKTGNNTYVYVCVKYVYVRILKRQTGR